MAARRRAVTDHRNHNPTQAADATGQPRREEQLLAPQQVPMDDAAGGPDVPKKERTLDETSTGDLFVQGGA